MRTAATVLSLSRLLESLVRRKRSCGVRRGADRKVPARAENSLAAYSTLLGDRVPASDECSRYYLKPMIKINFYYQ